MISLPGLTLDSIFWSEYKNNGKVSVRINKCAGGEISRRTAMRWQRLRACRCKSCPAHQMNNLSFENLKQFFDKYESYLSALTLILGFIFDYLTLERVDFLMDNLFIILYLVIAGAGIIIINLYEEGRLRNGFIEKIYEFLPFLIQFAFGGLFSAFVIFYSKSASFLSSGAFILILFILLVGNEFFKKSYQKLVFQVGIYFVALFSFSIFFLPVLMKQMGALIFLGSGIISLLSIGLFIFGLSKLSPLRFKEGKKLLVLTILGLYTFINLLYFTNIIPPIPISLKSGDVYHFVERKSDGSYLAIGESDTRWYGKFMREVVHLRPDEPAYLFSSVFAPTDLSTKIVHDWQYFDQTQDKWISASKIDFNIIGGRGNGFRGFSKKENIFPGKWRVDIKTERNQVIGRVRFDVSRVETDFPLETRSL